MSTQEGTTLSLSQDGQWVEVKMRENARPDRCSLAYSRAVSVAREHHIKRLLFDLSSIGRDDTQAEQFKAVQQINQTGLDKSYRVAGLIASGSTDHDFLCMAMQDAGYNVQFFANRGNAEEWLRG